jgi:hypothetical protein
VRATLAVIVGFVSIMVVVLGLSRNVFAQWAKPDSGVRAPGVTIRQAIEKRKEPLRFTLLIPVFGLCTVLASGSHALAERQPGHRRA